MNLALSLSNLIRFGSATTVVGLASLVVAGSCYTSDGTAQCCNSYTKPYGPDANEDVWTCPQTNSGGGGTVTGNKVMTTTTGGKTGFASNTIGTCTMTYTNCGTLADECTGTGSTMLTCRNTIPTGASCPSPRGGGR